MKHLELRIDDKKQTVSIVRRFTKDGEITLHESRFSIREEDYDYIKQKTHKELMIDYVTTIFNKLNNLNTISIITEILLEKGVRIAFTVDTKTNWVCIGIHDTKQTYHWFRDMEWEVGSSSCGHLCFYESYNQATGANNKGYKHGEQISKAIINKVGFNFTNF